jgi:hypothetical protein
LTFHPALAILPEAVLRLRGDFDIRVKSAGMAINSDDAYAIAARLREQAERDALRVTVHAHQEMVEEDVALQEIIHRHGEPQKHAPLFTYG